MENYNDLFRERTKNLALNTIKILSEIKYSDALGVLRKQAIRSAHQLLQIIGQYADQDLLKKSMLNCV